MREKFNGRRRLTAGLVTMALGIIAVATATIPAWAGPNSPAQAPIGPIFVSGNQTCGTLAPGTTELKVEPVASGTYPDGTLTVTITVVDTAAGPTFNWTSNIGVDAVFVKGGNDGNLYLYVPEATSGTGLHAPTNPANNKYFGLSHISFCYDVETGTTTTTSSSTTTSSTTTTMPTTTSSKPTTTSTSSTTTTMPTTTTAPTTTAPPTTAPPTTAVRAVVESRARPAELPRTGAHTIPLVIAGGALLAIGLVLVAQSRRLSHR